MTGKAKRQRTGALLAIALAASAVPAPADSGRFVYQSDARLDYVYIREAADFSRYEAVLLDPVSVWYPTRYAPEGLSEKSQENLARAQTLFNESIRKALSERYAIVDEPGRRVLRVHAEFIDLRMLAEGDPIPPEFARLKFDVAPRRITLVAELIDSVSGKTLARAADLGRQASAGGGGQVDWEAIASDFDFWAGIFADFMNRVDAPR